MRASEIILICLKMITYASMFAVIVIIVYGLFKSIRKNVAMKNGIETTGIIIASKANSGNNSGYASINMLIEFKSKSGKIVEARGVTVINVMDINKLKPGNKIKIIYSDANPSLIKIKENALYD